MAKASRVLFLPRWAWLVFGVLVLAISVVTQPIWWPMLRGSRYRAEQVLGCPLPKGATDVKIVQRHNIFAGDDWICAAMTQTEFDTLMQAAGLAPNAHLEDYWSSAFSGPGETWWSEARPPAGKGYFKGTPGDIALAAKYENGRLYLRRSIN